MRATTMLSVIVEISLVVLWHRTHGHRIALMPPCLILINSRHPVDCAGIGFYMQPFAGTQEKAHAVLGSLVLIFGLLQVIAGIMRPAPVSVAPTRASPGLHHVCVCARRDASCWMCCWSSVHTSASEAFFHSIAVDQCAVHACVCRSTSIAISGHCAIPTMGGC